MRAKLKDKFEALFRQFDDNDLAMEWCEDELIAEVIPQETSGSEASLADHQLFKGLDDRELRMVEAVLKRGSYRRGDVVVKAGDNPSYLYLVVQGRASVILPVSTGARKRLATFTAGMAFGEMAFVDRSPRSATVVADSELVCDYLDIETFEAIGRRAPAIKIKLLQNLCLELSSKLRKTNRELSVFE